MLSYNGESYNYDNLGNSLKANSTYNVIWTRGKLVSSLNASSHTINFVYDAKGLMITKSNGGTQYTYKYDGDKIIRQTLSSVTTPQHTDFIYGKEGLLGFVYNGETYLYQKNIFGDIIKIINSSGTVVGEYIF